MPYNQRYLPAKNKTQATQPALTNTSPSPHGGSWKEVSMPHDQAYYEAEKKIEPVNNYPRITTTNLRRMPAHIRLFMTPFVEGIVENKGGNYGA